MQLKLEEVLKDKERELKLYKRFQDLKSLCEKSIFPSVDLPLKSHIETLTQLIERLIPDPKDRTEEMFSGEIFALLGAIYLHDIGLVKNYTWYGNEEIFNSLDVSNKKILVNYGIGKELDIPEMAIEIINYLTFSDIVKKIPLEWSITEDTKKAIIRNTKIIEHIFNFSHLLVDVFYTGLGNSQLRRFQRPMLVLRSSDVVIDINSREGIIGIKCAAKFPYELHVIENAKVYVQNAFSLFKNNVNGRLGFQYKEIVWDITKDFDYYRDIFGVPRFSSYGEHERPPFDRWKEASTILDNLFNHGYAIVVGEASSGKTTALESFLIPQIISIAPNTFYCELWGDPVSEIRDIICKRYKAFSYSGLDIISICKKLLEEGPCFFVIDTCEKLINMGEKEQEKFERFLEFCFEKDNIFLVVSGDKEDFFEWHRPFKKMRLSAVSEIKPIQGVMVLDTYGEGKIPWSVDEHYKPVECEMLQGDVSLEQMVEDMLNKTPDSMKFRGILAVLIESSEKHLKRYTMEAISFETALRDEEIQEYLNIMKDGDIVKEMEFLGSPYFSLSNRYLKEPLYRLLRLDEFEEKKKIRNMIQNALINDSFLDNVALDIVEKWKDHMVFSKEGAGMILGSLIARGEDYKPLFEKAKHDGKGIDIQPILKLVYSEDEQKRSEAIKLLFDIQDKNMVNPLLLHLKKENVREIQDLLIKGISLTGKKRSIVAIMNTLKEIGESQLRLKAIDFFYSLYGSNGKSLLIELREKEDDPLVLDEIDRLLSNLEI
ncbi:MAG: hypothetical protein C0392_00105 [Syntrophus sp. (in: bacteria)]|nr:hypothetical protein [Syntrophus sp. (in: bacteria)]